MSDAHDTVKDGPRYLDGLPEIGEDQMQFTFDRSSGPGGQNVNRVATRATLWFDVAGSPSLTAAQRRRVAERLGGRINKDGRLRVVAQSQRTQAGNRRAAIERFLELLAQALEVLPPRRATRPTKTARRRRLEGKRLRGAVKRLRGPGSDD